MAGMMSREEGRAELLGFARKLAEKYLPEDESQPVKDGKFWEWEELADEFEREMIGRFLEVMAQVSETAELAHPGACPHCHSPQVRWLDPGGQRERQSKHGPVVLPRQRAQCRSCGRSFSPSGPGVGSGSQRGVDTEGVGAGQSGVGSIAL